MRPHSRLLAKKHLPTICETYEEILQDMGHTNTYSSAFYIHSDSLSSEDYLQSICHLARPTCPVLEEPLCEIVRLSKLDTLKLSTRLPKLPALKRPPTPTAAYRSSCKEMPLFSNILSLEGVNLGLNKTYIQSSRTDPLEFLYGKNNSSFEVTNSNNRGLNGGEDLDSQTTEILQPASTNASCSLPRANSFPRLCSPRLRQRKSSCPELHSSGSASEETLSNGNSICTNPSAQACPHPPKEKKPSAVKPHPRRSSIIFKPNSSLLETKCNPSTGREESINSHFGQTDKQTMISNWITDCKSAWREARIRACMLPAIAEM
ncbi:uncharacterized protein LOC136763159 [Amia ocellicauda]|uniref:uncharacterized protein LOC136763159 n=1 Tax=Amia ocellicauda TaxID=2972642 RepID=UPI0034639AD5